MADKPIVRIRPALLTVLLSAAASAAPAYWLTDLHTAKATSAYLVADGTVYVENGTNWQYNPTYSVVRNGHWSTLALPDKGRIIDVSDHGTLLYQGAHGTYFVRTPDGKTRSLAKAPGSDTTWPGQVNDLGDVAGIAYYGDARSLVTWKNGTPTLYGRHANFVSDINNAGVVALDMSDSAYGSFRAGLLADGKATALPGAGAYASRVYGLNDGGVAVGNLFDFPNARGSAAVWTNGVYRNAGRLAGDDAAWLFDVNNAGTAVGESAGKTGRAVVWDGKALADLNALAAVPAGTRLDYAESVNDAGQVLAWGTRGAVYTYFLLTPTPTAPTAVARSMTLATPEPALGALLAALAIGATRRRARRSPPYDGSCPFAC